MTIWLLFALMTGLAIFSVLWPLSRCGPQTGGSDIAVYRDQLDEIRRDRASGLIGEAEAERLTGVTIEELHFGSFLKILKNRTK